MYMLSALYLPFLSAQLPCYGCQSSQPAVPGTVHWLLVSFVLHLPNNAVCQLHIYIHNIKYGSYNILLNTYGNYLKSYNTQFSMLYISLFLCKILETCKLYFIQRTQKFGYQFKNHRTNLAQCIQGVLVMIIFFHLGKILANRKLRFICGKYTSKKKFPAQKTWGAILR